MKKDLLFCFALFQGIKHVSDKTKIQNKEEKENKKHEQNAGRLFMGWSDRC